MKCTVAEAEKRIAQQYWASVAKGRGFNLDKHMKRYECMKALDMTQYHACWIRIAQSVGKYPKD